MNAYLQLDAESNLRLHRLENKVITIELLPFHFLFQCQFMDKQVKLLLNESLPADAKITGTPLQLINVMLDTEHRQQFFASDVVMEGNAEMAQLVIDLFDELQIDHTECLAKLIGDVPAYHTERLVQGVKHWFRQSEQSLTQHVSDYLQEEAAWLPTSEELQDFYHDIDSLRMDVDRAEARIELLTSHAVNFNEDN